MTRHPRVDALQRFAAHEADARVAGHLAGCATCRSEVGWIRDVRHALTGSSPIRAPETAWASIQRRISSGETVLLPAATAGVATPRRSTGWRVAAAALVVAASGAAYALPGSPLRSLVDRILAAVSAPTPPTIDAPVDAAPAPAAVPTPATLVVPARDGRVLVAIDAVGANLRVRVRWVDRGGLEVRATGAAALARFTSGPGRVTISEATGGELLLVVPRDLRRVEVAVDGVPYVVQEGGTVTISAPAADTIGGEVVLTLPR
jgi:hypothetical protein